MYEQKNTSGEWDLVTNIEGHVSWYRQIGYCIGFSSTSTAVPPYG